MSGWRMAAVLAGVATMLAMPVRAEEAQDEPNESFWPDDITLNATLEVEATYVEDDDGKNASDMALATFELGIDATLNDYVTGRALFLWEEDDTEPIDLDEGVIAIDGGETLPLFLEAGKLYIPFGNFASHFVTDPLVLELGETRETAVVAGYACPFCDLQIGAFNGDTDQADGSEDETQDLVAALMLFPLPQLTVGASWISDIGDSDGLQDAVADARDAAPDAAYRETEGAGAFVTVLLAPVCLHTEYVGALATFRADTLTGERVRPYAWNAELAVDFSDICQLAVKTEGSDGLPELPELRYGAVLTRDLTARATLKAEYLRAEYNGARSNEHQATMQLALSF